MKLKIYSVFDKQLSVYGNVISSPNDITLRRDLEVSAKHLKDIARHPDFFSLHCVGEFDQSTGVIEPIVPRVVCEMSIFYGEDNDEVSGDNK